MRRAFAGAILAVALALGLILTLGPWLLGRLVELGYEDLIAELAAPRSDVRLSQSAYRRGWSTSELMSEVLVPARPESDHPRIRIRIDGRIAHGPSVWFQPGFPSILGRIDADLDVQGLAVALPPLPVVIDLRIDGSIVARLTVPPGESAPTLRTLGLRQEGIEGELRVEPDRRSLSGALASARAVLDDSTGFALDVSDLRMRIEQGSPGAATGRLEVAALDWLDIGDAPGAVPVLRVEGLAADLSGRLRADLLDLQVQASAPAWATPRASVGPSRIGVAVERIDLDTLGELLDGLRLLDSDPLPPPLRALAIAAWIAGPGAGFVEQGTRIAVDPVRIETPDGPVMGRLDLGFEAAGDAARGAPESLADWLARLRADGDLELPDTIARAGLASAAGDPAREAEAGALLAEWIRDGWVANRDGRIATALRLGDGLLTINGRTLPLGFPGSLR